MVDVAQLVRAPVCGTGGRGFKSRHPPHFISIAAFSSLNHLAISRAFVPFLHVAPQNSPLCAPRFKEENPILSDVPNRITDNNNRVSRL